MVLTQQQKDELLDEALTAHHNHQVAEKARKEGKRKYKESLKGVCFGKEEGAYTLVCIPLLAWSLHTVFVHFDFIANHPYLFCVVPILPQLLCVGAIHLVAHYDTENNVAVSARVAAEVLVIALLMIIAMVPVCFGDDLVRIYRELFMWPLDLGQTDEYQQWSQRFL